MAELKYAALEAEMNACKDAGAVGHLSDLSKTGGKCSLLAIYLRRAFSVRHSEVRDIGALLLLRTDKKWALGPAQQVENSGEGVMGARVAVRVGWWLVVGGVGQAGLSRLGRS